MTFTHITNPTFLRLQARILPLFAAFSSGAILSYMIIDNEHHKKFQKYRHIAIPGAPEQCFYVYMHTDKSYDDAVAALAPTSLPKPQQR